MIRAVVFDMDGVLIDSEASICRAAISYLRTLGADPKPEDFIPFVGAGEDRYIGGVANKYGIQLDLEQAKNRTYTIYGELIRQENLQPLPGAPEFIQKARSKNLKLAVASAADIMKVRINLSQLGFDDSLFDAIVTGSDVTHKKPDPEIFLKACSRLQVSPEHALVVEDAVNGVAAARSAGCRCLGILTSFTRQDLADADWHAADLAEAPDECLDW